MTVIAALAVAACQTSPEAYLPDGVRRLTGAQLTQYVAGRTIDTKDGKGRTFRDDLAPDGTVEYPEGGRTAFGHWTSQNDKLCYGSRAPVVRGICFNVHLLDDELRFVRHGEVIGTSIEILPGRHL